MTLWHDLDRMASLCKHSDEMLPADEVRALCRRAQAAVALVGSASEIHARRGDTGWTVTLVSSVDDIGELWSMLEDL